MSICDSVLYLRTLLITKSRDFVKSSCPARAMASEAESFTVGCMIRAYHVYKDVWSRYGSTRKVQYCRRDKLSTEGPFGSGTAEDKEL